MRSLTKVSVTKKIWAVLNKIIQFELSDIKISLLFCIVIACFNPLVPTKIKIHNVKMTHLQFDKVHGPEHGNDIKFPFGGIPFDLSGFEIRKFGY